MSSLNKVMIIGNLGADPEVSFSAGGTPIAKLRIATSETWKDKQSGERQEKTEWHRVVFFGRTAEVCGEYLRKGAKVYVEGRLQTSTYEKDGEKRYSTEIVGDKMTMLDSRGQGGGQQSGGEQRAKPDNQSKPANADFDDDIPF